METEKPKGCSGGKTHFVECAIGVDGLHPGVWCGHGAEIRRASPWSVWNGYMGTGSNMGRSDMDSLYDSDAGVGRGSFRI